MSRETVPGQLLHLVFDGELTDLDAVTFKDIDKLDIVGILLEPDAAGATPPR
jgi:hypothetical protein